MNGLTLVFNLLTFSVLMDIRLGGSYFGALGYFLAVDIFPVERLLVLALLMYKIFFIGLMFSRRINLYYKTSFC